MTDIIFPEKASLHKNQCGLKPFYNKDSKRIFSSMTKFFVMLGESISGCFDNKPIDMWGSGKGSETIFTRA